MHSKEKKDKVLVIEDSETMAQLLFEILIPYFEIEWTLDGIDALQKLKAGRKYDLIITNQIIPGIKGEEFIRKAKIICPSIPILAFTDKDVAPELLMVGADMFMSKPFEVLPFLRAVRRLLGYKDSDEELINRLLNYDR